MRSCRPAAAAVASGHLACLQGCHVCDGVVPSAAWVQRCGCLGSFIACWADIRGLWSAFGAALMDGKNRWLAAGAAPDATLAALAL